MSIRIFGAACLLIGFIIAGCSRGSDESQKMANSSNGTATKPAPAAGQPSDDIVPAGAINFPGTQVSEVLPIYGCLAGAEINTNQWPALPPVLIRFKLTNAVPRLEALRLLEKALNEQAGIVVSAEGKYLLLRRRQ